MTIKLVSAQVSVSSHTLGAPRSAARLGFLCATLVFLTGSWAYAQAAPPAPAASAPPPIQVPGVTTRAPAPQAAQILPPAAGGVSAPSGYELSASDQISVDVFGEDDLRTAARLGADGAVSLPLLGSVRLGGLTLAQAAARLTELYGRDYLVSPKVNVALIGYAKQRFTVLGQVNRPGSYEMPDGAGNVDILEAVAMAGGYTRIAAPERITVRRRAAAGDQILRVNAKRIARSGDQGGFKVQPGDTLTVGESIF